MYLFVRNKPAVYRNMHIGNNVGGDVNASYKWALGTTGVGVELRKEFLASSNLGHRERFITQLYFEHHFSFLNNRLQIVPGATWSDYSTGGNFFYPGLDVGFDLNSNHKIYGNIAKSHRIPTWTDLYYTSKTEAGNPYLKPESAWSYEIGYRYTSHGFVAKASFFGRESSDQIDWTRANAADIWHAQNIGNLSTKGLEAEFTHNLDIPILKFYNFSYTYLNIAMDNPVSASRYTLDNIRHQFTGKLGFQWFKGLTNDWIYRHSERVQGQSYHLMDTKLNYDLKNFAVYLLINNVTATKYTETFGVPMPGRWFHVGFNLSNIFKSTR